MRTLEVFSGENRSFSKVVHALYPTATCDTLDIRSFESYTPTYCASFESICQHLPWSNYDIVWFSIPCETYGRLAMSRGCREARTARPLNDKARRADVLTALVVMVLPLCKRWFIENPVGWLRVVLAKHNIHHPAIYRYCCFGFPYPKPTHIWGSHTLPRKPRCTCSAKGRVIDYPLSQRHAVPHELIALLIQTHR